MNSRSATEVVQSLRSLSLRCRTGIVLLPVDQLGQERDLAARLEIGIEDYRNRCLNQLPQDAQFLGLNADKILEDLDALCQETSGRDCVMLCNFDLFLARLPRESREYVWEFLHTSFAHRRRALLIAMPATASHLLPPKAKLEVWNQSGRLANADLFAHEEVM
jgi:hypothetical protein